MSTKKLEKVLEYLIAGKDDQAKDLLHSVFIEKARAIHEDLINMDEDHDDLEGDDMDEFLDDVEHKSDKMDEMSDEIEAEETMAEDETADLDAEIDMADDMDDDMADDMGDDADMMDMGDVEDMGDEDHDMDMGDVDHSAIEDTMGDLEDALAQLKAEFEKLEAGEEAEGEEEDFASDEEGEEDFDAGEEAGEEEEAADEESNEEEEEMDESWLAEFDDLDESISLEKVSVPHGEGEVGSGHYAPVETNKKSPVAGAPHAVLGAKPVKTGEGPTKSGFNLETAPSTKGELPHTEDNRRKKSTDKMSKVSKEGDSSAKLNKGTSDGFGEPNKTSPLSKSPRK